tara:strand:- start:66 stop:413 length:348 start_codon:yes stop_codon:yes gene_type:complete
MLGNSTSASKDRGKNKAVKVRRIKEVRTAEGYTAFYGTTVQSRPGCLTRDRLNQAYYHNGSSSAPATGDFVYSRKRAGERYFLETGYYKIGPISRAYYSMQIDSSGAVSAMELCR